MSDPRRLIKSLGRIEIKAKLNESGEVMNILTFADRNMLKNTSPNLIEEMMKEELKKVSVKPNTTLFRTLASFAYSKATSLLWKIFLSPSGSNFCINSFRLSGKLSRSDFCVFTHIL